MLLYVTFLVLAPPGLSIAHARENALREDLYTMRSLVREYTAEQHKRPQSLDDLVAARYLKHLPKDPMTNRRDSWTVERSSDNTIPGVVNVHSGASAVSSDGIRYSDW